MISYQTLRAFIRKELNQSLRDPNMKQTLFVTPVILLLVFGFASSNETKNVRLAVRMEPKDTLLRQVYDHALGTKWFIPAASDSQEDPMSIIERNEAEAVLIAPPGGLTQAVARGDGEIQLLVNGGDILRAQAIERYVRTITNEVVTAEANIAPKTAALHFDVRTLYNPSQNAAAASIPGALMLIILQITVVGASMSISREKETGTFETMISAPISRQEIIFGKTIPYVVLGMLDFPILVAMAHYIFDVPVLGSIVLLMFSTLVFVCAVVAAGALIGAITRTQQQSFMLSFLFIFPGALLSGVFFPFENMPAALKAIAYCDPLTHYLSLLRNILLKGGDPSVAALHLAVLILMAMICGGLSFRQMHTTLD